MTMVIMRKTIQQKRRTEIIEQSWVGNDFKQHWKDPLIAPIRIRYFKSSKNILNIVL